MQRSKLLYLVAVSSSSQTFIKTSSHYFKDYNPEIIQGVAWAVEMASYWFLCLPMCDAISMSVEADVEGALCFSNVLLSALPTFD